MNQLTKLVSVPNLHVIETIDSRRMGTAVEKAAALKGLKKQIQVFAQVNPSKYIPPISSRNIRELILNLSYVRMLRIYHVGSSLPLLDKAEPTAFVKHIIEECPHLKFAGMMVLGKNKYDTANGPNPEFLVGFAK